MALPPQNWCSALAKQEEGIEAAVSEGVDKTGLRREGTCVIGNVIEVTLRIRRLQIDRWRQDAILHSEHCRSDLEGGGRAKGVAHHRLCRANGNGVGCLAKYSFQDAGFFAVPVRTGTAMGINPLNLC